ncbi:hypothetical protein RSWS8N_18094 [Cereibacter sphaeroides WS8N]|uniref:regulatory protein GemA n=1 Tax=Cereibacter sphaeroides TaxID=1063 RepID=UPI00020B0322|nr:regulatory protein GemA [Cereibacter sphaeroides]EGJ20097.1 hypothetical protein RSWS8N_18094 [Cereibacter sphaeroides WS8N]
MTPRALQKLIHVGCRELGIDADTRRDLQVMLTGKSSMADMTELELRAMLDGLRARGFTPTDGGRPGRRPASDVPAIRFLHVMWRLLAEAGAVRESGRRGLNAFIRSRFGKSWGAETIDVDALRDEAQIRDVSEALKAMCRRAGVRLQ